MASLYTPQLTAWRAAEHHCVEHEGTVYAVPRRRQYRREEAGGGDVVEKEERERAVIGGKVFAVADEKEAVVRGGKVVRCVEYPTGLGAALRLTLTEGAEKEVAEVVEPDGALRVLECGGSYYETAAGTWEHVVDVQGEEEAFVLLVSVRDEEARIVRVQRLN